MAIAEDFLSENEFFENQPARLDPIEQLTAWAGMDNVAGDLEEDIAGEIASRVIEEYDIDKGSRADWEDEAHAAMDAVLQKIETKNHPWPKASNVRFPLLTTAALQFGARSYPAIIQGDKVVKVKVIGPDRDGAKAARADRIALHMSWQLLEEQPGWESDTDMLLHQLPVLGHAFRKVFRDRAGNRNCSEMVSAMNFVVHQDTQSIEDVPRATHEIDLYPHQIVERIRDGRFVDFEWVASGPSNDNTNESADENKGAQTDEQAPHRFLEQYRLWDLDGDGFPEPWIATVHKSSGKLVRLQANYDLNKTLINQRGEIARLPRYQYWVSYPFLPDPNGGFYGIGFGRLLKSISETVNGAINQLLDAGTLQTKGGGFIGSGLNVKKSKIPVAMNEWMVLNIPGAAIRDAIVPHQFSGPSPVLFQLLGLMIDAGKQIASVQEVLSGETSAKTMQPTTLLALIEQGLKVFTAIIKRVFRALSREFRLLYELNQRYPDEETYAETIDYQPSQKLIEQLQQMQQQEQMPPPEMLQQLQPPTMAQDYAINDRNIVPIADPNAVTDMQALGKAQVVWSAMGHPNLNAEKALRRYFGAAKIEDIDELVVSQQPDPMQVMNAQVELQKKAAAAEKDKAAAKKLDADAMKVAAETEHTAIKTESERHDVAAKHAEIASGRMDDSRDMDEALKAAQLQNALRENGKSRQ